MDRKEMLEELKKYRTILGPDKDINKFTDKQLKLMLDIIETMSQAADEAMKND